MVRIFRAADSTKACRAGYEVNYVADLAFHRSLDSCGVILVTIQKNSKSSPHSHNHLEEVFIALTKIRIIVNDAYFDLKEGDVVVVQPGEAHSFETEIDQAGQILALKFPNIKDDKVVPIRGNET